MTATSKPRVVLPPLHPIQQEVKEDPHRFKVLVAGRRFGKSILALLTCVDLAVNHGKEVWFVSPTYNNVMVHWRNAKRMVGNLASYKNEQQKYLEFEHNGKRGSIAFKSGDRPDNLLGVGLDYVVVDEAAYQNADVWYRVLRPTLSDRKGGALLISTPNGVANWFYRAYMAGQDPEQDEWMSWRFRTVDNPYIDPAEVAAAQEDLPELKFRQEFLAEFVSDAGGVFRNLEAQAVLDPLPAPIPGRLYTAGVDWGRRNDFTVVSVFDDAGDQVHIERFNQIGWGVQRDRIKSLHEKWGFVKIYAEGNSVGSANIEALQSEGLPVEPIYMTNPIKTMLVERFASNLERGRVRLIHPKHTVGNQQIGEMQSYSIERTRGGLNITYNAPSGWHDDLVIGAILGAKDIYSTTAYQLNIGTNPFYSGAPKPKPEYVPVSEKRIERAATTREQLDMLVDEEMNKYRMVLGIIPDEAALREKIMKKYLRKLTNAKGS